MEGVTREAVMEKVRLLATAEATRIVEEAVRTMEFHDADFLQIERTLRDQVLALGSRLLEQALKLSGRGYEGARRACPCGGRQKFISYRTKQMTTMLSDLSFERAYYHCPRCGRSDVPLDRLWDVAGTRFSPALREAVAWLSAEVAFGRGRELLQKLCGIAISKERLERIGEDFGAEIAVWSSGITTEDSAPGNSEHPSDVYVQVDGTTVHLDDGWREAKVGAVFTVRTGADASLTRDKTVYAARLTDSEDFGDIIWREAQRLNPASARRIVVLGDGAPWIWNQAEIHFPEAIQIVDWYHATERLWAIARILYGETSPRVTAWVKAREKQLWNGHVSRVVAALKALQPRGRAARNAVRCAIAYFQTHRLRMRYHRFREQNLFIGSGVVEGACKHIVGERLKKAGMRWSRKGATCILDLRVSILNHDWDTFWQWRRNRLLAA